LLILEIATEGLREDQRGDIQKAWHTLEIVAMEVFAKNGW